MSLRRKAYIWLRRIIASVALLFLAVIVCLFSSMFIVTYRLDAIPKSSKNYEPAAIELVKLCQSDPAFYAIDSNTGPCLNPFDPVTAPPSVGKLHPEGIDISANEARVYWGGGFYHCGWDLQRGTGDTWTLTFTRENRPVQALETIHVRPDQQFTRDEFVKQVLIELDRRLALQEDDGMFSFEAGWYLAAERCIFLARQRRVDLLAAEVHKSAATYPHDWRDVLLEYLIASSTDDPEAGKKLWTWANQTGGPTAWFYAAYACYQMGDVTSGDSAIKSAIASTSTDAEWIAKDNTLYELGMAVRLYQSGKFGECVSLCKGILSARNQYFPNRSSVQGLRDTAATVASSRPALLPTYDKFTLMDLFGGFDLNLLLPTVGKPINDTPGSSR